MLTLLLNQPAASGSVTATLAATLADATLSSSATVKANIEGDLAVTLADATLSSTATVPAAPVPITTGGGTGGKSWKRKEHEAQALKRAIRKALGQVEEAVGVEAVALAKAEPKPAPVAVRDVLSLPPAQDYSTELAHVEAITAALDRVYAELPRIQAARIAEARERRRAKVAKVRKLLLALDLADAA